MKFRRLVVVIAPVLMIGTLVAAIFGVSGLLSRTATARSFAAAHLRHGSYLYRQAEGLRSWPDGYVRSVCFWRRRL